jgi:O-antigen/teichoic acid export membrane protein
METDERDADFPAMSRHMARGALWMIAMRWLLKLIGLVNIVIIARVLTPDDLGLVAMATILVDFITTLSDGDVDMALVRSSGAGTDHYDTGWTVKIIAGLATCLMLWLCAPLAATYFNDERVRLVVEITSLRAAILGFENIGTVDFRRHLRFSGEFAYTVSQRLLTFVLVLALVFSLRNYLALAWAAPASAVVTVALSYRLVGYRPRLSLRHFRRLWTFSQWQILFNVARLVNERCDQFIIGGMGRSADVGNYYMAFDIAMMPTREIMLPAGRALLPTYAKLTHDGGELATAFRSVLGFAAIVSLAMGVGISTVAEDLTFVILGDKWAAAIPFFRLLGLFGALEGLWLMLDPYLIARHQERMLAIVNLTFACLIVPTVAVLAHTAGIGSIPVGRIGVMGLVLAGVFAAMLVRRWLTPPALVGVLWRPVIAVTLMALAIDAFHTAQAVHRVLSLAHDVSLGAVVFTAALLILWRLAGRPEGAESALVSIAAGMWARAVGLVQRK